MPDAIQDCEHRRRKFDAARAQLLREGTDAAAIVTVARLGNDPAESTSPMAPTKIGPSAVVGVGEPQERHLRDAEPVLVRKVAEAVVVRFAYGAKVPTIQGPVIAGVARPGS